MIFIFLIHELNIKKKKNQHHKSLQADIDYCGTAFNLDLLFTFMGIVYVEIIV